LNFEFFGLKKLVATHYNTDKTAHKLEMYKDINDDGRVTQLDTIKTPLKQNGDFRSDESIEILKEADIVVSNPPFSLFREYMDQLVEHDKKFIILGNNNAITYKNVFKLIKQGSVWLGTMSNKTMEFRVPDHYEKYKRIDDNGVKYAVVPAISWFTNMETDTAQRYEDIILYKKYSEQEYPKFDHYEAINVDKTKDIPMDYTGLMGVPITFLTKFNPDQFEIVDGLNRYSILTGPTPESKGKFMSQVDGKAKYVRVIIRNKNPMVNAQVA